VVARLRVRRVPPESSPLAATHEDPLYQLKADTTVTGHRPHPSKQGEPGRYRCWDPTSEELHGGH